MILGFQLRRRLPIFKPGSLLVNTSVFSVGLCIRAIFQILLFIALTRFLGVDGYGAIVAALAIASFLVPMVGLGSGTQIILHTAKSPEKFSALFGRGLALIGLSGLPLLMLGFILSWFILPGTIPWIVSAAVLLSELIFAPIIDLCSKAYQGFERFGRMSILQAGLVFFRLIALGVIAIIWRGSGVDEWAIAYCIVTALFAIFALQLVSFELGRPIFKKNDFFITLPEGFFIAVANSGLRAHGEADKAMLARLDSLSATGTYSAAHRLMDLASLPLVAAISSAYPRLVRVGTAGTIAALRDAMRLAPVAVLIAVASSSLMFCVSFLMPYLLGEQFAESAQALRWLTALPVLWIFRSGLVTISVACGHQQLCATHVWFAVSVNIGLNIILIPIIGWRGATLATYIAEFFLIFLLGISLLRIAYREYQVPHNFRDQF